MPHWDNIAEALRLVMNSVDIGLRPMLLQAARELELTHRHATRFKYVKVAIPDHFLKHAKDGDTLGYAEMYQLCEVRYDPSVLS
jgi:hypothetical protein